MTTSTATLTSFLLDRIADDEGQARADQADAMVGHRWKHAPQEVYDELQAVVLNWTRRVLAECAAKRRIVKLAADAFGNIEAGDYADDVGILIGRGGALSEVLTALALPYADHPDYAEAWRP